jgi:non-canonical purine NTP pyrophosphatase (RdgB/HAM1 family)
LKLLIATSNPGKVIEFRDLLKEFPFDLVIPNEIGILTAPEETGSTYTENALLKARFYFEYSHLPTLADDTGLEIDLLDGQPGLHSARFSSIKNARDIDRRKLLLEKLAGYPKPWTAHFISIVALVDTNGKTFTAKGQCDGEIITEERGTNGFGYDPIFLFPHLGKTMAELNLDEKNQISHRALAIKAILPRLSKMLSI